MKELLLAGSLVLFSGIAMAEQNIELTGAEYLEAGEEFFHRMDTQGIKEGDVVTVVDKRNKNFTLKAEAKKVSAKSLVLKILPKEAK